jgi:DNA-directed RNA polymerase specialized sigma24 family protein
VRNDDDEDIVQDSFLKAYKAQKSFRGNEAKTWVLTTVRNTAIQIVHHDDLGRTRIRTRRQFA